jgi:hypothetical protein
VPVVGLLLGVLGLPTALWFVGSAQPDLIPPAIVDDEQPLRQPFTVANNHFWFTMRGVRPVCHIFNLRAERNTGIEGGCSFRNPQYVGDLRPGSQASFPCSVSELFELGRVEYADFDFDVHYGVRWLPWRAPKEYVRTWRWRLLRERLSGKPFWVPAPLGS